MIAGKHPAKLTKVHVSSQDAQVEPSEPGAATLKLGETFETLDDEAKPTPSRRHAAAIKPTRSPKCAPPAAGPTPGAGVPVEDKAWKDLPRTPASKRSRSSEKLLSPADSAVAGLQYVSTLNT